MGDYTAEGLKRYRNGLGKLIREDRFGDAEVMLLTDLDRFPSDLLRLCGALPINRISITGWDEVDRMVAAPLPSGGQPCTAVSIDMSNHGEASDGGPDIEVSLYTDEAFPFSTSTKEDLLAQNETYSPPWSGCFDEIGNPLEMTGLGPLNIALESRRRQPRLQNPEDKFISLLGELFRALRFQQAVRRDLEARESLRPIPFLIGSNETGPYLETVYWLSGR